MFEDVEKASYSMIRAATCTIGMHSAQLYTGVVHHFEFLPDFIYLITLDKTPPPQSPQPPPPRLRRRRLIERRIQPTPIIHRLLPHNRHAT